MNSRDISNEVAILYDSFEEKLERIADKILLSKLNDDEHILLEIRENIERIFISSAMRLSDNNISKASRLLGINRNTLSKRLSQYNYRVNGLFKKRKDINFTVD
jgi:DNA-binding protein Fis